MADTERERIKAICEIAGVSDIEDLSDGFHTFAQLYYQRMILSAVIVKQNKNKSWKSLRHENGELCFGGGWFIVGIDTPEGSYTYHYETKYFDLFDCEIIDYGKHWDGHTEKDVTRLLALPSAQPEQRWIPCSERLPDHPENDDYYLVTIQCEHYDGWDDYVTGFAEWTKHGWDELSCYIGQIKVVAWMPLPEPYKGEE